MTNTEHCCGNCRNISALGATSTADTGIAETDSAAAHHAITATLSVHDLSWAVLATDGITNPLTHLGRANWATVATKSDRQLTKLLTTAHRWERDDDPTGQNFPRAKRHDDKTIATVPSLWL
ncbi:MAG: hypothetical protein ACRDTG_17590 [Pseudonocardiaceae bacterium]